MLATAEFKRALGGRSTDRLMGDLLNRLGASDARQVRPREYEALLTVFAEMFLPCRVSFRFGFLDVSEEGVLARCTQYTNADGSRYCIVRLHPFMHETTRRPPPRYGDSLNILSFHGERRVPKLSGGRS